MRDRAFEEQHLAEAEMHISQAERLIGRLEELAQLGARRGVDVQQARRGLDVMKEALAAFIAHRDQIIHTIRNIDAGRL